MHDLPTGTVTFLFTDIEGSTRLLQQLGDRYAMVLEECRRLLRATFQEWNGHEVDTQGDAFFVAFARATDAVLAAVEVQRALAAHPWPDGVAVHVRMGLHTGEPQRSAEGYVGLDVHHAARIMSAGHGGQVLLSQSTRDLVEHALPEGVHLQDLGARRLKDLQQPSQLFQLVISGLSADFPPLGTLDSSPNNLPVQPTPFLGREKEVHAVGQLLRRESSYLVTLTGPGGVGKTRLALQAAAELSEHFPDGTWFVSLAPIRDPDLVIPTISQALGLREARDQTPLRHVKHALQEKKTLLLLDNFEQVVSAALAVADLLAGCPRLKVLVTSREGLHLRAEREFHVPALALPDPRHLPDLLSLAQYEAVALFIERAQAVTPQFQVTNTNALAVAEICVRLDGLPLAIELAAARIRLFPPQALLTRLGQRLPLLVSSVRDVPTRQQTLRNTIKWSHDLLTADEQRLFRLLSVFVGGCALSAAESVSAARGGTMPLIVGEVTSLIDKNLLQQTAEEGEEPRLMMLETIREFGWEGLETSGELEATWQAHAAYYLHLAEEAEPELGGPHQAVWFERLEREYDNLRAALEWALDDVADAQATERRDIALRLSAALWHFWEMRGRYSEARTFLERALTRSEGSRVSQRIKVLYAGASLALQQGDFARAERLAELCLSQYQALGNTRGIADCLGLLVGIAMRRGEMTEAIAKASERVKLMRQVDEPGQIADALYSLADMFCRRGELARGLPLFEEALQLYRKAGNELGVAATLIESAIPIWWFSLVDAATLQTIRHRLQEGQAIVTRLGSRYWIGFCSWLAALVALSEGETARADQLAQESLAIWREIGDPWLIAWALHVLGRVEAQQGDMPSARNLYQQSLAITLELSDKFLTPFNLEGLAGVLAAQGELLRAVHLWGAAEALREGTGASPALVDRASYERSVASARTQLGEQAFAVAWADGRGMTLEQVLAAKARRSSQRQP